MGDLEALHKDLSKKSTSKPKASESEFKEESLQVPWTVIVSTPPQEISLSRSSVGRSAVSLRKIGLC